jgi:phosphotriesterase-related protein
VLGPADPESLGITLPHEHLFVDLRFLFREPSPGRARGHEREPVVLGNLYEINYDWFSNLDNLSLADEATAIEEVSRFRRDGGQTLVDPTTVGIGRDPLALQRVARATGLHIVMGSGFYTEPAHPPALAAASEDATSPRGSGRHGSRPG